MVSWFEKSKEVILSQGQSKDEAVTNMIEDLFDLLMVKVTLLKIMNLLESYLFWFKNH